MRLALGPGQVLEPARERVLEPVLELEPGLALGLERALGPVQARVQVRHSQ